MTFKKVFNSNFIGTIKTLIKTANGAVLSKANNSPKVQH